MTDRLGICTHYRQHETARAAVQLADLARDTGRPSSLFSLPGAHRRVSPQWDDRVLLSPTCDFATWARTQSRLLWTFVPDHRDIAWCQSHGIETWLLVSWEALCADNARALSLADKVLCPYACVQKTIKQRWLADVNTVLMPWDLQAPQCTHRAAHNRARLRLLLPLHDSQAARVHSVQAICQIIDCALRHDHVDITLLQGCNWSRKATRAIRQRVRQHGRRLRVARAYYAWEYFDVYANHDLTIWPSQFESLASIGLLSLWLGTPVMAWDVAPQSEYLRNNRNSVLVSCELQENWLGVPYVRPDYGTFTRELDDLLQDKARLTRIRAHPQVGLPARRKNFLASWDALWT